MSPSQIGFMVDSQQRKYFHEDSICHCSKRFLCSFVPYFLLFCTCHLFFLYILFSFILENDQRYLEKSEDYCKRKIHTSLLKSNLLRYTCPFDLISFYGLGFLIPTTQRLFVMIDLLSD